MTIEQSKTILADLKAKNPHMFDHPGAHTNEVCFGFMPHEVARKMVEQLIEIGYQSARRVVDDNNEGSRVYLDAFEHAGVPTHK